MTAIGLGASGGLRIRVEASAVEVAIDVLDMTGRSLVLAVEPVRGDALQVHRRRLVLREILAPPTFGAFVADIARRLGMTADEADEAARGLEDRLLAHVQDGYAAASGAAMEFDALWPIRL